MWYNRQKWILYPSLRVEFWRGRGEVGKKERNEG
jgi:hypothetical protein